MYKIKEAIYWNIYLVYICILLYGCETLTMRWFKGKTGDDGDLAVENDKNEMERNKLY